MGTHYTLAAPCPFCGAHHCTYSTDIQPELLICSTSDKSRLREDVGITGAQFDRSESAYRCTGDWTRTSRRVAWITAGTILFLLALTLLAGCSGGTSAPAREKRLWHSGLGFELAGSEAWQITRVRHGSHNLGILFSYDGPNGDEIPADDIPGFAKSFDPVEGIHVAEFAQPWAPGRRIYWRALAGTGDVWGYGAALKAYPSLAGRVYVIDGDGVLSCPVLEVAR